MNFKFWLESFDQCYEKSCRYAKEHSGEVWQVVGPIGNFPNADPRWLKLPQVYWSHYVAVIGEEVYDWNFDQFDPSTRIPLVYAVGDIKKHWRKIYQNVKNELIF